MRKTFRAVLVGLFAAAAVLSACGSNTSSTTGGTSASATSVPASENGAAATAPTTNNTASAWTGTITMFAQQYTPNKTGDATPLTALREIADEYQKLHPGITIEFIDEEFQGYNDIVRTKAAAGELWDVYWAQWASLSGTLPEGVAVDLAPYFQQKNPYIADTATWQDAMNQTIVNETAAPSGARYNINGDFVATAFFYNKKLFAQAGITTPPTTWPELIEASQKLQAVNIPAVVHVPLYSWWQRHFLSDFYAKDYDTIAGFDKAQGISALDEAVAIRKGILNVDDPRFIGWWPTFKDLTQYWVQDYITRPPDDNEAAFQDFLGGKAAMIYSGSWLPNQIRDADPNFEFASFNFPVLDTQVNQYSTSTNSSNAVGGPNAGFQYAMSTPRANKTMEEPGKTEAVLDWLRYIGTPQVVERDVNEDGSYIPTWPGTKPLAGVELLADQANQRLRAIQVGSSSAQLDADLQRTFGLYLSGNIDIEQAKSEVGDALNRAADDYITKNNVNIDQY